MKKAIQVVTGFAFFIATILNVDKFGFNPATTCSLISGFGFFVTTLWSLVE